MAESLIVSASGIRGIVGEGLTPEVVARYGGAYGEFVRDRAVDPVVLVGRDSRTSGELLQSAVTAGLRAAGVTARDMGVVPTPTGLLAVEDTPDVDGGVLVTASHNPAPWNGLKLAASDGSFLTPEAGREVQATFERGPAYRNWTGLGGSAPHIGAIDHHIETILALPVLDPEAIAARRVRVVLDCVHGAGGPIVPRLLERLGCEVIGIGLEPDGVFPRNPEPAAENLEELAGRVLAEGADIGLAVDPDVDRLAIVDEHGRAIGEDWTLALVVEVVATGGDAPVVTNLSSSQVIADAAARAGVPFERAPVGEANVVARMRELGAVLGGEGNGGVILPALHYTRDAPLAAALILQWFVGEEATVGSRIDRWPRYRIVKRKVDRGDLDVSALLDRLAAEAPPGAEVDRRDGLWLGWENTSWLHVRPSGTEPILRIIAEAPREVEAIRMADWVQQNVRP